MVYSNGCHVESMDRDKFYITKERIHLLFFGGKVRTHLAANLKPPASQEQKTERKRRGKTSHRA